MLTKKRNKHKKRRKRSLNQVIGQEEIIIMNNKTLHLQTKEMIVLKMKIVKNLKIVSHIKHHLL